MLTRNGRRVGLIVAPVALVLAAGITAVALYAHGSPVPQATPPAVAPTVMPPDAGHVAGQAYQATGQAKQDILLEVAAVWITPDGAEETGMAPAGSQPGEQRSWVSMSDLVEHTATYAGPTLRYDFFRDTQRGYVDVDYAKHTYKAYRRLVIGEGAPHTDRALHSPDGLLELLRTPQYLTTATNQSLNGRATIELAGAMPTRQPGSNTSTPQSLRIWVDATTYLPMRKQIQINGAWSDPVDYTWLPATPANQALVTSSIPPGFGKTS
ncbi:MAG TPA: hypothetical protein VHZ97_13535 [Pseudonocardiaceae bacterium]|nr:hypothetical protein [Pseudonocardiaceae bacterium]